MNRYDKTKELHYVVCPVCGKITKGYRKSRNAWKEWRNIKDKERVEK
jgi:hypothetical protein